MRSHIRVNTCTTAADAPAFPPFTAFFDDLERISDILAVVEVVVEALHTSSSLVCRSMPEVRLAPAIALGIYVGLFLRRCIDLHVDVVL